MSIDATDKGDKPLQTPDRTYAPAAMAMGISMTAWGTLTHWSMSLVGMGLFVWALSRWIHEICMEWRKVDDQR
jgi:hypothetical protein